MEYIEVNPLPAVCVLCKHKGVIREDCIKCYFASDRWRLSPKDQLILRKEKLLYEIEQNKNKIAEIDKKLLEIENSGKH